MPDYSPEDLRQVFERAGTVADHGVTLTEAIHRQLDCSPPKSDLRSRSVYFLAVTAHDFELGIRVVHGMLFNPIWDLLYGSGGPSMYPGAKANANHFQEFIQRGAFLGTFSIFEGYCRGVHRGLAPGELSDATDPWYKIWKSLESKIGGFRSKDDQAFIRLIATVRNCIHDSGTFRGRGRPTEEIEFLGSRYLFTDAYPPNCLTLDFIIECIRYAMGLIEQISLHRQVKVLPPIENYFDRIGQKDTVQPSPP